jgi:hypothetical protein
MARLNDPDNYREGFSYILTKKGKERASADVGLMFIAYNLRRIGNILTADRLKEYLRILVLMFLTLLGRIKDNLMRIDDLLYQKSLKPV